MRACALTGRDGASRHVRLPVVEGTADHGVLSWLQHHVAAHKLLHGTLAVRQQAAQGQLVPAAEGGSENHDAQVQQVAVHRVGASEGDRRGTVQLAGGPAGRG